MTASCRTCFLWLMALAGFLSQSYAQALAVSASATTTDALRLAEAPLPLTQVAISELALSTATSDQSWLAQAQTALASREYEFSLASTRLQAPNRANGFRTYFDAGGIALAPRDDIEANQSASTIELKLRSFGRDEQMPIPTGNLSYLQHKVSIDHGAISQWYLNTEKGLEQGFDIAQRPRGPGALIVNLDVRGARAEQSGANILLRSAKRSYQYSKLLVLDASGQTIPATMLATVDGIAIHVDDQDAKYPLTIDPLITATADVTLAATQAGMALGVSVAGAGDVNGDGFSDVIVGANNFDNGQADEGAAFIYFGGAGAFDATADAMLESNQASSQFGYSVAGAGDVNGDGYADVVVGAYWFNAGENDEGAAFVYFGGAGAFNTVVDAQMESNQANTFFGKSVGTAGDVNGDGYADVIVGAYRFSNVEANEGAAFIYFGGAGTFNTTADAQLEANQASSRFGESVSTAGDVNGDGFADVIVGANEFDNLETDEGAAFIYFGGAGAFNVAADAQLEPNLQYNFFGTSVANAGDVNGDGYADVIIGATGFDVLINEGAAYIYLGGPGAFDTTSDALMNGAQQDAQFGISVAGAGDTNGDGYADVVVGAHLNNNTFNDSGRAFVYLGRAGAFNTVADVELEVIHLSAQFGKSVASAGDVNGDGYSDLIVGAQYYNTGSNGGAAFIYFGGAREFNSDDDGRVESNESLARLGYSVAGAGDVNGDGFADAIVGAHNYDSGGADQGAAFIYFGGAGAFDTVADAVLTANQNYADYGLSVAGAGDINGDGYADVLVGAASFDNGDLNEGAAYIYYGGAGTFNTVYDARLEGQQLSADFGISVSSAGDVNGDGYSDILIGAPGYDSGQANEGAAFLYYGGAGAFNVAYDALLQNNQAQSTFGSSVAGAGDANGDGFADLIIGSPDFANGQADEGAAFIYFGSVGAFDTLPDAQLEENQASAKFGTRVAGAGDLNGDGFADVIVGAPDYNGGFNQEGGAFIYYGGAGAFDTTAEVRLDPDQSGARLGSSVAAAGDLNGDGYGDVIVGAPSFDSGELDEGAAFIYYGGLGAFDNTPDAQLESNQMDASFGQSVAGAGDINGDGYADVIVGSPEYDKPASEEGVAFIYYGNKSGRSVLVNQYRGDGSSTPVQPWGISHQNDGFVVAINATSPRGRERVRLQVEACPNGKAFADNACHLRTQSSWSAVPANSNGLSLVLSVLGLPTNTLYHWRARVQYAAQSVNQPGITSPPNPVSGPWRRLQAQAQVADVRTGAYLTVTPSSGANGSISPNSPQTVFSGQSAAFTVSPNVGYRAVMSGTCGGTLAGNSFTSNAVTANCTVVANFVLDTYQVTSGAGANGSISPSGVQSVNSGATASFVVTPNSGFAAVVGGTCGGSLVGNTYTTNPVSANCSVIAAFTANTFQLIASAGANGSISPSGVQIIGQGATTSFTLTPNAGFASIVGGTCGGNLSGNTYTTNPITANCTVVANFVAITFQVVSFADSNGAISPSGAQVVAQGATAMFTVTPNSGYAAIVGGTCGGTLNANIFTTHPITANCTVVASFSAITFQVGAAAGANGVISPSGIQVVAQGASASFTVTPDAGFAAVVGGTCGGALSGSTYTTNPITANCTVIASFTAVNFQVLASAGANGTISPSGLQAVAMGATTTFVVSPNAGHSAVMSGTCGGVLAGNIYTTASIVANCTVIANFVPDVYQVTPSAGANGSISPSAVQNVSHGATRQFSITPSSGYSAVMSGSCGGVLSGSVYTTNPITGSCSVIATFELIDLFKNGFE